MGGQPFAASGRARVAEVVWNRLPEWVRVPYVKCVCGLCVVSPSSSGLVESAVNLPGPSGKSDFLPMTDSGLVP